MVPIDHGYSQSAVLWSGSYKWFATAMLLWIQNKGLSQWTLDGSGKYSKIEIGSRVLSRNNQALTLSEIPLPFL